MVENRLSRSVEHFESLYRMHPDPWGYITSNYESEKYEATLAALGARRFSAALEVGCSIGVLTERLAQRCDRLLAIDFAPSAVAAAGERCAAYSGVRIHQAQVPQQWPEGNFDLIVFSEVLYFFAESDLEQLCRETVRSLLPEGEVLLVNFTDPTDDPGNGEDAASSFIKATAGALCPILQHREPHYRIDLLRVQVADDSRK